MSLKKILKETSEQVLSNKTFYHGTKALFPFKKFESRMDGSGIVSMGNRKYGGFFFSDNIETAEYFTEWLVAEVKIKNIQVYTETKHPPTALKKAVEDNKIYMVPEVIDGSEYSNVVVVPHKLLNRYVDIVDWHFVGDEEFYKEVLTEQFGDPEEDEDSEYYISKNIFDSFFNIVGLDKDYIMREVPVFKEYYNSL